ncbi:hypothetical protein SH1V18_46590 [Vallitalea longa]|uniref:MrpA C-terminal/MbhE domain-containing protein n=1 Tax=Vallitalea longa TaxID=2936439 RepID=A0A9W6DIR4_9FIRM|nr:hydrogen gas-evolving membrane-bound hydrogenase subunit E [Vallitalea longa]GKX32179.1 hypothetical protein SH1V18_46590 [Vallitalea longa]
MRRKLLAIFLLIVFLICISLDIVPLDNSTEVLNYYVDNSLDETGSVNVVTSIYLNYRVFDTIFETLLLLISIIGIIYFSRHEGDY